MDDITEVDNLEEAIKGGTVEQGENIDSYYKKNKKKEKKDQRNGIEIMENLDMGVEDQIDATANQREGTKDVVKEIIFFTSGS